MKAAEYQNRQRVEATRWGIRRAVRDMIDRACAAAPAPLGAPPSHAPASHRIIGTPWLSTPPNRSATSRTLSSRSGAQNPGGSGAWRSSKVAAKSLGLSG
jgi:hypothetical protein